MARHLFLVAAPDLTTDVLRAALDGRQPLAVLPDGPAAVVEAARAVLRPEEPLEPGADLVVVTSGSTGGGRGVLLPASAVRASAAATLDRIGGPGGWLLALPVSSIAGLQVLARGILSDRPVTRLRRDEPLAVAVARLPAGRRYTSLVPTQLRRYLDTEPDALRGFEAILVGGAATDTALRERARRAGVRVVTTYGMTETAGGCVYDGRPLDGVRLRVAEGVELAGPTVALGYRLDPAATEAAFADGWFRTRDAGTLDADGRLTVTGRLDDVVVSGGVNVAPAAVESALREHPRVADAVVFGRPDETWGQRVVAVVVPAAGTTPELGDLRSWVTARLGAPAAPRQLHVLDALPLLHTGKPDRHAVAALTPEV
ncbi:MAG TPA: o-succinylbenzoate--CoA ligase [Blastococcus sp.]|nr:o-succinylbenzoate--CoA ligase [Blastococcus sp.]